LFCSAPKQLASAPFGTKTLQLYFTVQNSTNTIQAQFSCKLNNDIQMNRFTLQLPHQCFHSAIVTFDQTRISSRMIFLNRFRHF
jgi:hypothetical protein